MEEELKNKIEELFKYNSFEELMRAFRALTKTVKCSYKCAKDVLTSSSILYEAFVKLTEYNEEDIANGSKTIQDIICKEYFNNRSFSILLGTFLELTGRDFESFFGGKVKAKNKNILSMDEVAALIDRVHAGDEEARAILVERNTGLVRSLAGRYSAMARKMDYDDLFQEGIIGLLRAIDEFDYTRGCAFSTYATYWIRQSMTRSMGDFDRTIRVSFHLQEKLRKMTYVIDELSKFLGREPSVEEISVKMGLPLKDTKELMRLSEDAVSLESKVGDDSELIEFISSETTLEDDVIRKEYSDLLWGVIKSVLDEREYDIVSKRMGYYDGRIHTLEEIAASYNITRERVRQIENKIFAKLQRPSVRKLIEETENAIKDKESKSQSKPKETSSNPLDNETLSSLFGGCNIESIRQLVETNLTDKERHLLYMKYGKELDTVKPIGAKERNALFSVVIPKLYKELKSSNKNGISNRLIQLFLDYSPLEIRLAIFELKREYKEYMFSMFGINLMEEIVLNREQIRYFNVNIFPAINANLEKNRSMKVLLSDIFPGVEIGLIKQIIPLLPSSNQEIIYSRFGRYLDELNVICPESRKRLYGNIIPQINAMINDKYILQDNYLILSHFEGFNFGAIIEVVNSLPVLDQKIIYRRFGKNLYEVKPINSEDYDKLYNTIIPYMLRLLKKEETITPSVKPHKDFFSFFPDFSKAELLRVVDELPRAYRELLYKRYGGSLADYNVISKRELTIITGPIFKRVKALLANKPIVHSEKTLLDIFSDYSEEEIASAVSVLSPVEKALLKAKYGDYLDDILVLLSRDEAMMIPSILDKISNYFKGRVVNGRRNDSFYALVGLPKAVVLERMACLSDEEREAIYEYCGYDLDHVTLMDLSSNRAKRIELHIIKKIKREAPSVVEYERARSLACEAINAGVLSFQIDENKLIYLILRHGIVFPKPFTIKNILGYVDLTTAEGTAVEKEYYEPHVEEFDKIKDLSVKKDYVLVKKGDN